MKITKSQKKKTRICPHPDKMQKLVTFKNGTEHLEERCASCYKFFGYKSQRKTPEWYPSPKNGRLEDLYYDDTVEKMEEFVLW